MTEVLDYLRQQAVLIYVNTGRVEPTFVAMGRGFTATLEDIDAAIRFLECLRKEFPPADTKG